MRVQSFTRIAVLFDVLHSRTVEENALSLSLFSAHVDG